MNEIDETPRRDHDLYPEKFRHSQGLVMMMPTEGYLGWHFESVDTSTPSTEE